MNRALLGQIAFVWRKEMLDTLRDRRTLLAMIVLPLLVYPVLIIGISQLGLRQVERIRESTARVVLEPRGAAPELEQAIRADTTLTLLRVADAEKALQDREIDALLRVPDDFETILSDGKPVDLVLRVDLSRDRGRELSDRMKEFLVDWRSGLVERRLEERGLDAGFVRPFGITIDNAAGPRKMGGSLMGRILPVLLVVMMMTGALYPAIDVTAGERERGTLETLLVSPGNRFAIVMGKYFTVFVASMVTTLANLVSMGFTIFYLVGNSKAAAGLGSGLPSFIDWRAFLLVFIIMIPMALFFCGLAMLVASFARSFKEAQNYLSPLLIACMAPAYLAMLPGFDLSYRIALIPIANVVLLSRELLLGSYPWNYFAVTLATMTGLAVLMLSQTVSLFGREAMLGGGDAGPRLDFRNIYRRGERRAETLTPAILTQVFALVLLGFFYIGTPLQLADVKLGLIATQVVLIAGIPVLAMRMLRIPVRRTLGLGPTSPSRLVLALFLTPAATLLAALAASFQGLWLQVPSSYRELMEQLIGAQGGSLPAALIAFAVIPGLCEEILFRGFILRGLLRRLRPAAAIFWTAALFGAFHFDLYRLVPTLVLGLVLGWTAWRTGRLWPAVVIHVTNNAFAVLSGHVPALERIPWLREGGSIPFPVALLALILGGTAFLGLRRLGSEPEAAVRAAVPAAGELQRQEAGSAGS